MNGWEYLESVQRRALELAKEQSPYYNIAPLFDLIKQADAVGCDVVWKPKPSTSDAGAKHAGS